MPWGGLPSPAHVLLLPRSDVVLLGVSAFHGVLHFIASIGALGRSLFVAVGFFLLKKAGMPSLGLSSGGRLRPLLCSIGALLGSRAFFIGAISTCSFCVLPFPATGRICISSVAMLLFYICASALSFKGVGVGALPPEVFCCSGCQGSFQ